MQQFGPNGASLYEETTYFTRPESAFPLDESTSANCATFLGLDECLDRHLKSSTLTPLNDVNNNGDATISQDHLQQHLEFEIDDNGQLLNELLQQQQQCQEQQHQQQVHQQQQLEQHHHEGDGQQQSIAPSSSEQQSMVTASWEESIHVLQEMLLLQQHQALQCPSIINDPPSPSFPSTLAFTNPIPTSMSSNNNHQTISKFPGESELLSLLQLPRCASSSMPSSIDCRKLHMNYTPSHSNDHFANYQNVSMDYDPHLLLQQQAPTSSLPYQVSLKHLFQSSSQGPHTSASTCSALVQHLVSEEIKEPSNTFNIDDGRQFGNAIFDFKRVDGAKGETRGINHFATERQRREYLNEKYQTLRSLVPNPTKADRASIVQDAIEYVKELKRTVQELQLVLQERNRHLLGPAKKRRLLLHASNDDAGAAPSTGATAGMAPDLDNNARLVGDGAYAGGPPLLRSSLLQRTSQHGTHVDVRIVEDDVNIKLTHKKRSRHVHVLHNHDDPHSNPAPGVAPPPPSSSSCASSEPRGSPLLLDIALALHDLHLDLLAANGATIGDHHVFTLNTKVMEGSSTYASQVATKLLETIDRQACNF